MAGQNATITAAIVGNGSAVVLSDNVGVEVYEAFARNSRGDRTHSVRRVADRTGEAILRNVIAVLEEAGVSHHIAQIMALRAHPIGSVKSKVWIRKRVGDQCAGSGGLTELIVVLKNMRVDRTVRTVRPRSAKLAIVVAVVAIGAENLEAHQTGGCAVLVQHVRQ